MTRLTPTAAADQIMQAVRRWAVAHGKDLVLDFEECFIEVLQAIPQIMKEAYADVPRRRPDAQKYVMRIAPPSTIGRTRQPSDDPRAADLVVDERTRARMRETGEDYGEAMRNVLAGDPELRERYAGR